jgi:hypothetical protein
MVSIAEDIRLSGITMGPNPILLEFLGERIE